MARKPVVQKQFVLVVVAALVLVAGIHAFMEFQRTRPATPVEDLRVEVTSAGETREIAPYTICELDQQCDGGEPPTMPLDPAAGAADAVVRVRVPEEIAALSWRVLMIYDDPAANSEYVYTSGESSEHEIEAATASGARLVVAEVSALTIGTDAAGEETPVIATWSIGFD